MGDNYVVLIICPGVPRSNVLAAFFKSAANFMIELNPGVAYRSEISLEEADYHIKNSNGFIDVVYGIPIKIDVGYDTVNATTFDLYYGKGAGKKIVDELNASFMSNSEDVRDIRSIRDDHMPLTSKTFPP